MFNYINRGPVVTVQDPLHPGRYVQYRDLNWQAMPEIISFTDYLRCNYTLDYGAFIRRLHEKNELPLLYYCELYYTIPAVISQSTFPEIRPHPELYPHYSSQGNS